MQKHLQVPIQLPYYTYGSLTPATKNIWMVCHGQGQLAEYFLKKFEVLDPRENYIIAPQGLSKYYLGGFTGRVGASWMTKEDRLVEIENQSRYIDAVLEAELGDAKPDMVLFGFSQGVATMMRYAAHAKLPIQKMILWAGTVPPELTREQVAHWPDFPCHFFLGDQDQFNHQGHFEKEREKLEWLLDQSVSVTLFPGKHEVFSELLIGL